MFILKSTHAALMAAKDREIVIWQKIAANWEATAASHVRVVTDMVEDIKQQVHARTPQPVAKREPDQVDTAIDWKAQGNVHARRHLERWAKGERRKGRKPEDIAADIMNTRPTDDDEPVDVG